MLPVSSLGASVDDASNCSSSRSSDGLASGVGLRGGGGGGGGGGIARPARGGRAASSSSSSSPPEEVSSSSGSREALDPPRGGGGGGGGTGSRRAALEVLAGLCNAPASRLPPGPSIPMRTSPT